MRRGNFGLRSARKTSKNPIIQHDRDERLTVVSCLPGELPRKQ